MKRASLVLLVLAFAACGGGATSKKPNGTIDSVLEPATIKAGETATVTCPVQDKSGKSDAKAVTTFAVDPTDSTTATATTVSATKTGAYNVACACEKRYLVDDSPAVLTVTPGDPVKVTTTLAKASAEAGETVAVTCKVEDAYGNVDDAVATTIDPVDGLLIADHAVSSEKVGKYTVACAIPSAKGKYEKVPASLDVGPAKPAKVQMVVVPDYQVYSIEDVVTIGWKVWDAFGNPVEKVPATVTAPVGPGLKSAGLDKFEFAAEGIYEVKVELDPPNAGLSDARVLICDQSPPVIVDLFPPRGWQFMGDAKVVVSGKVIDTSKIDVVKVNGHDASVETDGTFSYDISSVHGLNGIEVAATDEHGYTARTTRGYYYSTDYIKVLKDSKIADVRIDEALMIYLGQTVLDDGDHDPSKLDDIATILEVVLGSVDFTQLIGSMGKFTVPIPIDLTLPIEGFNSGFKGTADIGVGVGQLVLGSPRVTLTCRDGGIAASISFEPATIAVDLDFALKMDFVVQNPVDKKYYTFPLVNPSVATGTKVTVGKLGVGISFDIELLPGGELQVEGKDFQLELSNVAFDPLTKLVVDLGEIEVFGQKIDLGEYDLAQLLGNLDDLLAQYVLNPLVNFITQPIVNLLEPFVTTFLGDAIKQIIGLLAIEQKLEIPPIIGNQSIPLDLSLALSSVVFKADGGRIGMNMGVLTDKKVDRDPIGSILRDGCGRIDPEPVLFDFGTTPEAQIGLRYDAVNELLFMVWWSGLLSGQEIDLSGMLGGGGGLPIENVRVTPNFLLPPILDDCNAEGRQQIQVGDAYLDLKFTFIADQQVGIWLQVAAAGGVAAKGNQIGIRIDGIDYFVTEIIDVGGNLGDLLGMVEGFIPTLLDMVAGQEFLFPIPEIALGGIVPGIPAGAKLSIGNLAAYNKKGVAVVGGDLQ